MIQSRQKLWISGRVLVAAFALFAAGVVTVLVIHGGPDWPLFFLLIPVLLAAPYYPRPIHLGLLGLSIGGATLVVRGIYNNPTRSYQSIAAVAVAMLAACEALHRMMQGRVKAEHQLIGTTEGLQRELAERRRAEQLLRESEDRYRRLIETSSEGVVLLDTERRIRYANQRLADLLGHPPEALIERPIGDFIDEDERAEMESRLATGTAAHTEPLDCRFRRQDGTDLWAIANTSPFPLDESGSAGVLVMLTDVTERRRLEEELRQSQKMEAIGKLAGGVAHDFNNILTVIIGHCDLLLMGLPPVGNRRNRVGAIREAGHRAARLTGQLLALSRKAIVEPRVIDLNEAIASTLAMLRPLLGEDIVLSTRLAPGLSPVRMDPGQVEQVIINLAVNARDAMPKGGSLTIGTQEVDLPERTLPAGAELAPGRYVQMTVSDTGEGMSEEVLAHAFEPFFTTKDVGKGTGLGLATVYGVFTQAGGHISVESRVGVGTTFTVLLSPESGPVGRAAAEHPGGAPRGKETVLVAEDEEAVRELLRMILADHGYTVLDAGSGPGALQLLEVHRAPVDLLITDVVMPELGGRELAEQVRDRFPGVRVLYVSGHTDDALIRHGVASDADAFLHKPFTPIQLAWKVREVLDHRA